MKGTVLTLSNGRYDEFKNAKRIETIGSVRFDTEKHKIVGFGENKREVEVVSRFLSVDPLAASYPELTPYQFASNTPLWATDLDGAEADFTNLKTKTTKDMTLNVVFSGEIKVKIQIINLSSNSIDMSSMKKDMEKELNQHYGYSEEYTNGDNKAYFYPDGTPIANKGAKNTPAFMYMKMEIKVKVLIEVEIINDMSQIKDNALVGAVVDNIPVQPGQNIDPAGIAQGQSSVFLVEAKYATNQPGHNTGTHETLHMVGGLADDYSVQTGKPLSETPNIMQGGGSPNTITPKQKEQIKINIVDRFIRENIQKKNKISNTSTQKQLKEFIKETKSTIKSTNSTPKKKG